MAAMHTPQTDVTPGTPAIPSLPRQFDAAQTADIERLTDARIRLHVAELKDAHLKFQEEVNKNYRQRVLRQVGIGLGGMAVGVGSTLLIQRARRRRAAQAGAR